MKLYYAAGGGLGHLSRGWALAQMWGWTPKEVVFVSAIHPETSFEWVLDQEVFAYPHLAIPPDLQTNAEALQVWLLEIMDSWAIEEVFLDSFPSGLIGEWSHFPDSRPKIYLIARNLTLASYAHLLPHHPAFEAIYRVEHLFPDYQQYLNRLGSKIEQVDLQYPSLDVDPKMLDVFSTPPLPKWLIVHSGNLDETEALVEMALDDSRKTEQKPDLILLHPYLTFGSIRTIQYFPAYPLFPYVDQLFTAGGFNLLKQAKHFQGIHKVLPFPRKYDNQFFRMKKFNE